MALTEEERKQRRRESSLRWAQKNREYYRAYHRAHSKNPWPPRDPNWRKLTGAEIAKRWREAHPERARESNRRFKLAHPLIGEKRERYLSQKRAHYAANRERIRARNREKYRQNPEYFKARARAYEAANRAKVTAAKRTYFKTKYKERRAELVRDRYSPRQKLKRRLEYAADPSRRLKANREWRSLNKHIVRDASHRRKARVRAATTANCAARIKELWQESNCHWCQTVLTKATRTIDHVVPIARGGEHAPHNLVAACFHCNSSKRDRLPHEWRPQHAAA